MQSDKSQCGKPTGPLAGTYRWIEEATPFLRDLLKSMPESSAKSALDSLLMGVPCEPQDLGFDSPGDRFARWYHAGSDAHSAGGTNLPPDQLRGEERKKHIHDNDCPTAWAFFNKHALGSMLPPSCLVCGHSQPNREEWGITHAELPNIIVCLKCRDAASARSAIPLTCSRCGDEWRGQACVSDCPLHELVTTAREGSPK